MPTSSYSALVMPSRPKSRLGARARGGPYPRLYLDYGRRCLEGFDAWRMIIAGEVSVRRAAAYLGLSPTTAWRRAWWFQDAIALPKYYGLDPGPIPPQRGTRAVPRGAPPCRPHQVDQLLADYAEQGVEPAVIARSEIFPAHVRNAAAWQAVMAQKTPAERDEIEAFLAAALERRRERRARRASPGSRPGEDPWSTRCRRDP